MTVVADTSAIIAIFLQEPGHERLEAVLDAAKEVLIPASSILEAGMVLSAKSGRDTRMILQVWMQGAKARVVPFDEDHAWAATGAFLRFGKGNHAAGLNFSDCMSYATSLLSGAPLLYVGNDFSLTDVVSAIPRPKRN